MRTAIVPTRMKVSVVTRISLSVLALLFISASVLQAAPPEKHSFAIYLVAESQRSYAALRDDAWPQVKLAKTPIISDADIVSYDILQHAMTLTPAAMKRATKRSLAGTPFVVVADGERIYAGYFTSCIMSVAFPNPAIVVDRSAIFPDQPANTLYLDREYPESQSSVGPDPRADKRIVAALTALGKLVSRGPQVNEALTQKIGQILNECRPIRPGITREELLRVFTTEGGLSTPGERTYVHRRCPYIKIDVQFNLSQPDHHDEQPTDTITKASRPYLQWSVND